MLITLVLVWMKTAMWFLWDSLNVGSQRATTFLLIENDGLPLRAKLLCQSICVNLSQTNNASYLNYIMQFWVLLIIDIGLMVRSCWKWNKVGVGSYRDINEQRVQANFVIHLTILTFIHINNLRNMEMQFWVTSNAKQTSNLNCLILNFNKWNVLIRKRHSQRTDVGIVHHRFIIV